MAGCCLGDMCVWERSTQRLYESIDGGFPLFTNAALQTQRTCLVTQKSTNLFGGHATPQTGEQLSYEERSKQESTFPEPERVLSLAFNGTRYGLDIKFCTGGVVFRKPLLLNEICVKGNFEVRASFCNRWDTIQIGHPGKSDCHSITSEIQSFHPNYAYVARTTTTTTTTPNPNIIPGPPPVTNGKVIPFTPTLSPMLEASLFDDDLNPNVTNSQEVQVERNSLLKKRQTGVDDNNQNDFGEDDYDDDVTTSPPPPVETSPSDVDEEQDLANETDATGSGGDKAHEDLLPVDDSNTATNVPGLLAVGDKIVNDQIVEENAQMLPGQDKGEGSSPSSSENDDLGEWENLNDVLAQVEYHPLPEKNTLEYDVVTGGMSKWFLESPSPIFDSQITVLKAQIGQSLGLAPLSSAGGATEPLSSVLEPVQPRNATWYKLLERAALVADHLIPPTLVPDRRPDAGGESSQGFKLQFLYHALMTFGYFTRTIQDEDVDVGLEDDQEFWNFVLEGMSKCVDMSAEEGKQKKFILGGRKSGTSCDNIAELELSKIMGMRWNEQTSNFNLYSYSINYTHNLDPNSYLPPHAARINSRLWIFAELMWYSVQISYAYCFLPFSENNPDAFMMAYAKLIKIFETQVVQNLWSDSAETSGGNLNVYENFLPFIQHSAFGDSSLLSNSEDFKRALVSLDKVSFAVHEESLLNHWIQRPSKRGGKDKEIDNPKRYWDNNKKRRRRRRRAVDFADGSVPAANDISQSETKPTPVSTTDGKTEILGVVKTRTETEKPIVVNFEKIPSTTTNYGTTLKSVQFEMESKNDKSAAVSEPPLISTTNKPSQAEPEVKAEVKEKQVEILTEAIQALKDLIRPMRHKTGDEIKETGTIPQNLHEQTIGSLEIESHTKQPFNREKEGIVENHAVETTTTPKETKVTDESESHHQSEKEGLEKHIVQENVLADVPTKINPDEKDQGFITPKEPKVTDDESTSHHQLEKESLDKHIVPENVMTDLTTKITFGEGQEEKASRATEGNVEDLLNKPVTKTVSVTQQYSEDPKQETSRDQLDGVISQVDVVTVPAPVTTEVKSSTQKDATKERVPNATELPKQDKSTTAHTHDEGEVITNSPHKEVKSTTSNLELEQSTLVPEEHVEIPAQDKAGLGQKQTQVPETIENAKPENIVKSEKRIQSSTPPPDTNSNHEGLNEEPITEAIFAPAIEAEIMMTSDAEKHLDSRNLETQENQNQVETSTRRTEEGSEAESSSFSPINPTILTPTDELLNDFGVTPAISIILETPEPISSKPSLSKESRNSVVLPDERKLVLSQSSNFAQAPAEDLTGTEMQDSQDRLLSSVFPNHDSVELKRPKRENLEKFEIWNGLAYCLVLQEGSNKKNALKTIPSYMDLENSGICQNEFKTK